VRFAAHRVGIESEQAIPHLIHHPDDFGIEHLCVDVESGSDVAVSQLCLHVRWVRLMLAIVEKLRRSTWNVA
jgi:hypothetical protein